MSDESKKPIVEEPVPSEPHLIPETMLLSETILSRDWDSPEEDEAWANL